MFGRKKSEDQPRKNYRVRYPAKAGYRHDTKINFKSKMEANIFRWLKTKEFDQVEYEPEIFYFRPNKFGIKAYVPDFKVYYGKRFHFYEVKGYFEKSDYQKAWLVRRDYSWIKIYFITAKEYKLIQKFYSKKIPHWEWYNNFRDRIGLINSTA